VLVIGVLFRRIWRPWPVCRLVGDAL